jgi:phospholipase/carboxylesterase
MSEARLTTEFVPALETGSRRLMVMLHGLGDSVAGYRWLPVAMQLPWLNYLLVNAPDEYYGGFSWYDYAGDIRPGVERSRKLLFKLLDDQRDQGYAAEQITLGGFSQGSLMAIDVATRYPHRLAGVVGISGYLCEPDKLAKELSPEARKQRFLMTHGTYDPMLDIQMVREQVEILKLAGLNITWKEFAKEHTIAGEEEMSLIRSFVSEGYKR